MNSKKKKSILQKLKQDEHYYGTFGKQYLSNSDISTLLNNPLQLSAPSKPNPNFLVGGYFHTAILEPEKLGFGVDGLPSCSGLFSKVLISELDKYFLPNVP